MELFVTEMSGDKHISFSLFTVFLLFGLLRFGLNPFNENINRLY